LVEGQLDRFTLVTEIGPPDATTERELLLGTGGESALDVLEPLTDPAELTAAIDAVRSVYCAVEVADYAVAISNATRVHNETAIGASPRASLALLHAAQAHAVLEGRTYVVPDDIARLAVAVLAHRLVLRDPGRLSDQRTLVQTVLDAVPAPRP
jgi:MoxR-like ATPase